LIFSAFGSDPLFFIKKTAVWNGLPVYLQLLSPDISFDSLDVIHGH